jgi:hypothetical protein
MEGISSIERVNTLIKGYIDFVYREYITSGTCPITTEAYNDWFIHNFLQSRLTRWSELSCYDITKMFTVEEFFDNNVLLFSEILQILHEYFEDFSRTMDTNLFDPKNIMRCYTSVYVCKNMAYFLDKYREEFDNFSNTRSDSSEISSLDLFVSYETNEGELDEGEIDEGETDGESTVFDELVSNYDNDMRDIEEDEEEDEDDEDDTVDDGEYSETGVFVTQEEFLEKNTNTECVICWDIVMNHHNSMKWKNCDHFSCADCHCNCYIKKIRKCPLCRC